MLAPRGGDCKDFPNNRPALWAEWLRNVVAGQGRPASPCRSGVPPARVSPGSPWKRPPGVTVGAYSAKEAQTNSLLLRAKTQRPAYAGGGQAHFLPKYGWVGSNSRARLISLYPVPLKEARISCPWSVERKTRSPFGVR